VVRLNEKKILGIPYCKFVYASAFIQFVLPTSQPAPAINAYGGEAWFRLEPPVRLGFYSFSGYQN